MKKSVKRFREIIKVLAYYGFGYIIDSKIKNNKEKAPENLRKAFEELGPTFIKIGQILSTRPDILPYEYIEELSKLQNNVFPVGFKAINKVFFHEFNKNIDEVFLCFDKKPLASASVSQVHKATLKDGRKVIVKIQRPNIKKNMNLDLSILSKIFNLTKAKFSDALINPKEAIDELIKSTEKELDFNYEKENIIKFKKINSEVACIYAPFIIEELSSEKVITMEEIQGIKINDKKILKEEGYDLNDIGRKLALSYFKQVFKDGFFHGDPHPGNMIIRDGKICFVDFGIMGSLSIPLKDTLNEVMLSVAYNDIDKMISAIFAIGKRQGYIDRNKLYEDIDYIFASYLNASLSNIKISTMLQEVFEVAKRNNIQLPKDLTILIRSMVIMEGVIAEISPDVKILDLVIPYVKETNGMEFLNDMDFDKLILDSYVFLKNSIKLPSKTIELINSVLTGRAKIQLDFKNLDSSVSELNKMVNRLIWAIIVSAMIMGSSFILKSNVGPKMFDMPIIGIVGFFIAAFMGFWLLISIFKSGKM